MEGRIRIGQPVIGFWYKRVGREYRQIRTFIILRRDGERNISSELTDSTLSRKASSEI